MPDFLVAHDSATREQRNITVSEIFDRKSVKDYGAIGDGANDDTDAIRDAIADALPGDVVYFPAGTYKITSDVVVDRQGITLRGQTPESVAIVPGPNPVNYAFFRVVVPRVTFEQLTFFPTRESGVITILSCIEVLGADAEYFTCRQCRFDYAGALGYYNPNGVYLSAATKALVENCDFLGPEGYATGTGVLAENGGSDISVRDCSFDFLCRGVRVYSDNYSATPNRETNRFDAIEISRCQADMHFWDEAAVANGSNSGGTVSYTPTTITDTTQDFTALGLNDPADGYWHVVRTMEQLPSGTLDAADQSMSLTDNEAAFVSNGVRLGDIIRTADRYAVVRGAESENVLRIEGWRDRTTYRRTKPPAATTAYTLYRPRYGRIMGIAPTTLTIQFWRDLVGDGSTPASGTLYEVCDRRPEYAIYTGQRVHGALVDGNTVKNSWADSINVSSLHGRVTNNDIELGADIGITLGTSDYCVVANNTIRQMGVVGVYVDSDNSVVANNVIIGPGSYRSAADHRYGVGIHIADCDNVVISGNAVRGEGGPMERAAWSMWGATNNITWIGNSSNIATEFIDEITAPPRPAPTGVQFLCNDGSGVYDFELLTPSGYVEIVNDSSRWRLGALDVSGQVNAQEGSFESGVVVNKASGGATADDFLVKTQNEAAAFLIDADQDLGVVDIPFEFGLTRKVIITGSSSEIRHVPSAGGWVIGSLCKDTNNQNTLSQFGHFGNDDALTYSFIGPTYTNTWQRWAASGVSFQVNVTMAGDLDVTGDLTVDNATFDGQVTNNRGGGTLNEVFGAGAGAGLIGTTQNNAIFGAQAGAALAGTSQNNVMLGYRAGILNTGSGNICIGASVDTPTPADSFQLNIGDAVKGQLLGVRFVDLLDSGRFDESNTAGMTRFLLHDNDTGTLQRVSVGADDSGGPGYRMLRIQNTTP